MTTEQNQRETITHATPVISPKEKKRLKSKPPLFLRIPDGILSIICLIAGLAIGLEINVLLHGQPGEALIRTGNLSPSAIGEWFSRQSGETLVRTAIFCMFAWGIMLCLVRWARIEDMERISGPTQLQTVLRLVESSGLSEETNQMLVGKYCQASPLLRRLQGVLRQWSIQPGLQEADIVLSQYVNHDHDSIQTGYSLIRVFVWALPVLGLVGTVMGIADAVGGFSSFLGGDVDDVTEIKKNLVGVTTGLSFAFMLTLYGLLTSLVTMLLASGLQTREEKLYARIQDMTADSFLPLLQRVSPAQQNQGSAGMALESWRQNLDQQGAAVLTAVETAADRLLAGVATRQDAVLVTLEQTATGVMNKLEELGARVGERLQNAELGQRQASQQWIDGALANQRAAVTDTVGVLATASNQWLTAVAAMNRLLEELRNVQATEARTVTLQREELRDAMAYHRGALEQVSLALTDSIQKADSALDGQVRGVHRVIEQLQVAKLDETLARLTEQLGQQTTDLGGLTEAVSRLAALTGQVTNTQTHLHEAMQQWESARMPETLQQLSRSLELLGPVLDGFRRPFVFQAVPLAETSPAGFESRASA